jgi:hypothetical protein
MTGIRGMYLLTAMLLFVGAWAGGCGSSKATVAGNARFRNGATPGASSSQRVHGDACGRARGEVVRPGPIPPPPPANGQWLVSPDQVQVRITGLQFIGPGGDMHRISLGSDCVVTYDKAAPSLSTRLDCPFTLEVGTYETLGLQFSDTYQVLIDDEANGLFTDPAAATRFSPTRPAGGAGFVDYRVPAPDSPDTWMQSARLTAPLVVTDGQPVSFDIVMHGLHTLVLDVTNGAPTFRSSNPTWPVLLYPSVNGVSTSEFYTAAGTADSFAFASGTRDAQVLLFYESATVPASALFRLNGALGGCGDNGPPHAEAASAEQPWQVTETGERPGGYLGLDGDTLCWAQRTDERSTSYSALLSLTRLPSEGATGTLSCQSTSSPPPPTSGTTYAAACPELSAPQQLEVMLVAN